MADRNTEIKTANNFYDINGLIEEQIRLLDSVGPYIIKKAIIGGNEEITQITPEDSTAWSKEMNIFKAADINKPLLRDSYQIEDVSVGNMSTTSYKSKNRGKTIVEELSIQFVQNTQKPIKIHASLDSRNLLFNSVKTLEMHFQNINGKQMIRQYKSDGWQKMISKDSTYYSIVAEVVYP